MRLISIVGARPQFVKVAAVVRALERHRGDAIEHRILHTGQHYDASMSDTFFAELDLPEAAFDLGVGSDTHARQTAAMLSGIEQVLGQERPDVAIVYGDTNSTLAGALAAAKLGIATAHVESGLRSFDRRMPEEINRTVADHVCDLLLAPTANAMRNLTREGLAQRSVLTGDLMYDVVLECRADAERSCAIVTRLRLEPGNFGVVTLHRAQNTDDPGRLVTLVDTLNRIAAEEMPLVFPLHPRTAARLKALAPSWQPHSRLLVIEPVGYYDSLRLLSNARVVLTDSGGLQKEAFFLGCPCITLRAETEWVETLEADANVLADADPARIRAALARWTALYPRGRADFSAQARAAFGSGDAAQRIVAQVCAFYARGSGAQTSRRIHQDKTDMGTLQA